MSNLLTRSISGLVYVLIILGAIFFVPSGSFLLAALLGSMALTEWQRFKPHVHSGKYSLISIVLLCISLLLSHSELSENIKGILGFAALLVTLYLAFHSLLNSKEADRALDRLLRSIFGLSYIILPMLSLALLGSSPWVLAGVFMMIWCFDSFAYLSGRLLGRHKMSPSISPNKTWEGFAGGTTFTALAAWLLSIYTNSELELWHWLTLSGLVTLSATLGDLFESALKRNHGLKDSGNLMPGHGGILDRIDSLLVALPITFLFLKLVASNNI